MLKVAVTGGLACGKSTVCKIFQTLGAFVVSSDQVVHELLSPGTDLSKKIAHLLGPEVLDGNQLSRKKIADKVFQNVSLLSQLESLIHPELKSEVDKIYRECQKTNPGELFVVEVPLLFESKTKFTFDKTIAVICEPETCLKRYLEKGHTSKEDFKRRRQRQIPDEKKAMLSDFVIENNGTLEDLQVATKDIWAKLKKVKKD